MGPLKECGQIATISRYDCIFEDGIFRKYYYITFTCSVSCVAVLVLSKCLASGAKLGFLCPGLEFSMPFCFFF